MVNNRAAFGILALACVLAAGAGAYVASRHNAVVTASTSPVAAPTETSALPIVPAGTVIQPGTVTETEAVIDEGPKAPAVEAPAPKARLDSVRQAPRTMTRPSAPPSVSPRPSPRPGRSDPPVAVAVPAAPPETSISGPATVPGDTLPESTHDVVEPASQTHASSEPAILEPVTHAAEPPRKEFEDLVVAADSVLGLQIDTALSSERARVEDPVEARVTRDVKVHDDVAIPSGSKVYGSVTLVDRGGKVKDRARLGIRFHTLVLADGTRMSINTETVYREGASPTGESSAKIGGAAIGGAILGAILGGGRGAVIGGTAGAAGGTAAVMAGGRNAATVAAGSTMTVRILDPVTVTVEKEEHEQ